jgi:beta-glucosidase-like glycosyl hydrolase
VEGVTCHLTYFSRGFLDRPCERTEIDYAAHEAVAQAAAEAGCVLLKNEGDLLPLKPGVKVAVIGGHADVGVLSGGGSSQVIPSQARSSSSAASYSGLHRVASMSSMRRMKRPFTARAASNAVSAEKAWPRWRYPVREGAKRVTKEALTDPL